MKESRHTLVEHLDELRARIIKSLFFLLAASLFSFYFSDQIISFLVRPVGTLIFTAPQEAFVSKIKVSFFCGLLIAFPLIFYQAWRFISTGLRPQEHRYALVFLPLSFLFFFAGAWFGYFIIVPIGIRFLLGFATDFLSPMITINAYLSFVLNLTIVFALVFQTPIVMVFLTKINILTPAHLSGRRKHAIVVIFIAAALFTPPDVITQSLMAIPLLLLYELGILFSKLAYQLKQNTLE